MLKDRLVEAGAIKFGDFVLTSGKKSNYYVDIKDAATDPATLEEIASELASKVSAQKIAGMELGAVPITVATAVMMKIPYLVLRKERSHGTKKLIIGHLREGEEIELIEDVVTTGGSLLKAAQLIRDNGGVVKRAIVVVDREEGGKEMLKENGIELVSVVKISDVKGK
ncbi:orotate phosphoribosyltransferase [uncultured archaeon]|nr:orotate phosphoribosyltransferase [uncultured archaeon]HKJ96200.1 orotate phosphoribosyltransferase [Thermoplasmataceae archaeon]